RSRTRRALRSRWRILRSPPNSRPGHGIARAREASVRSAIRDDRRAGVRVRERMRDPEYVHHRRGDALVVLCPTPAVLGIDNSVLNVTIPTLSKATSVGGLGATASELQWIVDAYILVFAGLLLTTGSLGDRFGRYRFLNIGLVVFGTASVVACEA